MGRVLSFTAMSVPNPDRFAALLCSEDEVDERQVVASNYFNQFSLPDSATINNSSLTALFTSFGFTAESASQFQKQLWWYNGSFPLYAPLPRVVNDSEVPPDSIFVQLVRQAIPLEPRPCVPREKTIGKISIPVLFVCGETDPVLLCSLPSVAPGDLVPDYTYYGAESCGHDFFLEGDCTDPSAGKEVMTAITDFIMAERDVPDDTGEPTPAPVPPARTSTSRAERKIATAESVLLALLYLVYGWH